MMRKKVEQCFASLTTSPVWMMFFTMVAITAIFSGITRIIPRAPCLIILFICLAYYGLLAIAWYRLSKKIRQSKARVNQQLSSTEKYFYLVTLVQKHVKGYIYDFTIPVQKWTTLLDVWLNTLVNNVKSLEITTFDIAACFIFTFLECGCSDDDFRIVFDCVKEMIQIPRTYITRYTKSDELILILNSEDFSSKAYFMLTNSENEAAMNMCRMYFLNPTRENVLELSSFLHALHYMNQKKK